jgi:hypothetical protein
MPRQMASSGTPCRSAWLVTDRSQVSRVVTGTCVRGCRAAPYRTGSMSGPPVTTRPSRPATVALASSSSPPGGSSTARPPLRRTESTYT